MAELPECAPFIFSDELVVQSFFIVKCFSFFKTFNLGPDVKTLFLPFEADSRTPTWRTVGHTGLRQGVVARHLPLPSPPPPPPSV